MSKGAGFTMATPVPALSSQPQRRLWNERSLVDSTSRVTGPNHYTF
jgi:hypothetical protein